MNDEERSRAVAPVDGSGPDGRARIGRLARDRAPRSSHADWEAGADRRSPIEILAGQDKSRVPDLVPVRYGRMLDSPFTFYRGAAAIMAADLATMPSTGIDAQLCGDAHLSNFGAFQAPDRRLVFDINDFDETRPGPFEWDVKRLAASLAVCGRARGFKRRDRQAVVTAGAREYRRAIREFADMRDIDIWYSRLDVEQIVPRWQSLVPKADRKRFEKNVTRARNKDSLRAVARLTERRNGDLRIARRPPVLEPIEDFAGDLDPQLLTARLEALLAQYRGTLNDDSRFLVNRYRYVHAGRKVVGVGSVGTRAWIALLLGRDEGDPLFLQVKEAQASVLEPYLGRSRFRQHGHRVVAGQRLIQAAGDALLGWLTAEGLDGVSRDFYVRQLWDGKGSAEVDVMGLEALTVYAHLCGWTLARAHARSGDAIAIAAYLGKGDRFDRAIAEFAESYGDQNEADYATLIDATKSGRIEILTGV